MKVLVGGLSLLFLRMIEASWTYGVVLFMLPEYQINNLGCHVVFVFDNVLCQVIMPLVVALQLYLLK